MSASAKAQDAVADKAALGSLFGVRASLEACDFPATPADVDALDGAEERLIARLNWTDEAINALYGEVESGFAARSWDKLCADPTYKMQILEALGALRAKAP